MVNIPGWQDIRNNGGREGCDVVCQSRGSQFHEGFFFHYCATVDMFFKSNDKLYHISTYPNIVHEGYKFTRHRGTSH
jgi:hypothetical protein